MDFDFDFDIDDEDEEVDVDVDVEEEAVLFAFFALGFELVALLSSALPNVTDSNFLIACDTLLRSSFIDFCFC